MQLAVRNATLDMHYESKRRDRDENERRDGNQEVFPSQRQSDLMSKAKDSRDVINFSLKDVMTIGQLNERLDGVLADSDKDPTGDDMGELLWELAMKIRIQASEAVEAGNPLCKKVRIRVWKNRYLVRTYAHICIALPMCIYIYIYMHVHTQI